MTTEIRRRRGTTAEHADFVGAEGEVTVDTAKKVAVVHDGETPGGQALVGESAAQTLSNKTLASPTLTGEPEAPTPAEDDDSPRVATTAWGQRNSAALAEALRDEAGAVAARVAAIEEQDLPDRVETLEENAFAADPVYADIAAGLAATTDGQQFKVEPDSPDIAFYVYLRESAVLATLVSTVPSVAALATKADQAAVDTAVTALTDDVRGRAPALTAGYAVPQGLIDGVGIRRARATAAGVITWAEDIAGGIAEGEARSYRLAASGDAREIEADGSGRVVSRGPLLPQTYLLPAALGVGSGEVGGDGRLRVLAPDRPGPQTVRYRVPRGHFEAVEVDLEGNERAGRRPAVTVAMPGEVVEAPVAGAVTGQAMPQAWLQRSQDMRVPLTFGPYPAELVSADPVTGTATVLRRGAVHQVHWRETPLSDGGTMHLLLWVAQSVGQGYVDADLAERLPAWRDPVGERAYQFRAGDGVQRGARLLQVRPVQANSTVVVADTQLAALEPLRGSQHGLDAQFGQLAAETCAASLIGQHLDHRDAVLAAVVGTGSTPIADFAPATPHYQSAQKAIAAAAVQAALRLKALKVWLIWNQGEADDDLGTAAAVWKPALLAIRDGLSAYAVTQGATFGGMLIEQCVHRIDAATPGMATLAQADLIAAGEAMGVALQPMRPGFQGTGIHLGPLAYLPLGPSDAWQISETIRTGTLYKPPLVAPGAAVLTDSLTIDCTWSGGNGSYAFDTATMPDDPLGLKGIRVSAAGLPVAVASVAFTDAVTLRVTLDAEVVIGDAPLVEFGLDGPTDLSDPDYARVNVRDTSARTCPATGQIASGWAIHHRVAVVAP